MKYKTEIALGITVLLCILSAWCGQFFEAADTVRSEVLRLHILANSDSEEDQNLKLKVRDRLLAESESWFAEHEDKRSAEVALQGKLKKIAALAEQEIISCGYEYPVSVSLCRSDFSTRQYENFTLPAGEYDTLRISIGAGEGKNWWCVIFPGLCIPSAADSDWFAENDLRVLQNSPKFEPRFALVEWLKKFSEIS